VEGFTSDVPALGGAIGWTTRGSQSDGPGTEEVALGGCLDETARDLLMGRAVAHRKRRSDEGTSSAIVHGTPMPARRE